MGRDAYDEKLERILRQASTVIAEKGYHRASMRDIARAADVSLSGLYHYFESKEELLFLIQRHCLDSILERLRRDLADAESPEEKLRVLVHDHLRFFVSNRPEMTVVCREADSLTGEFWARVTDRKREYTAMARDILESMAPDEGATDLRVATFALFGMMNWIYNWYRPERDVGVHRLADEMLHVFLRGFRSAPVRRAARDDDGTRPSLWT